MSDQLSQFCCYIRDWVYDNYHLAFLIGTALICQNIFFPDFRLTLIAWLVCVVIGILLEPCVNPYRTIYGRSLNALPTTAIALTFDDGPGPDTAALLDLLKQRGIKANFFLIGQQIRKFPDVVRRMAAEGHLIGNHSYSHSNMMLCTPAQTLQELERVQEQIQELTGQKPTFWRPPFGYRAPWTQVVARKLGLRCALWSINPRDFHDPGCETILKRIKQQLQAGAIILLHDGRHQRGQTLKATAQLLDQLFDIDFVRLDAIDG